MYGTTNTANMKLFVIMLISATMFSCKSETERFVCRYRQFTTDISENYSRYNSVKRDSVRIQYKVLRDRAKLYESEMTNAERLAIDSCNYKINALLIRKTTDGAINSVGNFLNEATGTLKELIK